MTKKTRKSKGRVRIKTEMKLPHIRLPKGIRTPKTKLPKKRR